jgi:hypothetical protein
MAKEDIEAAPRSPTMSYGTRKPFKTSAGTIFADTRAEAVSAAERLTIERPVMVQGPNRTPSLRELGVRAIVRRMNRAGL